MNIWNGAIGPNFSKHRDFAHGTFFAHLMDNGGSYRIDQTPVDVKYRLSDAMLHSPSDRYYFVDIDFAGHSKSGTVYEFLVHAEPDLSPPNFDRVATEVNEIVSDPIVGGRDWFDYLDFDSELTNSHPRVRSRLNNGEEPRLGPPRQRRAVDRKDDEDSL